ncbi:hypothetical protein CYMTET_14810 [Cymbomonas tetramitiformis]|uniref:Protein kinase domain-containing protein n=1 Tax=Cymbomonas tetramitiformis TaxID=36881 RepID=A0AAE0GFI7_9CHLO|nr:hypothetical protein CYMTET_14810 [Cymbomonas tetramitiformis]
MDTGDGSESKHQQCTLTSFSPFKACIDPSFYKEDDDDRPGGKISQQFVPVLNEEDVANMHNDEVAYRVMLLQQQLSLLTEKSSGQPLGAPTRVFSSVSFTDGEILQQLTSTEHQKSLSAHNWPVMETLGPDFFTLATAALDCADDPTALRNRLEEGLDAQQSMPGELRKHLKDNFPVFLSACREVAESYLNRKLKVPKASGDDADAGDRKTGFPAGFVLEGEHGRYCPVSYLASGSAGEVWTAMEIQAQDEEADLTPESTDSPGPRARSRTVKSRQNVLKRVKPSQKDSAEQEFIIARKLAQDGGDRYCIACVDRIEETPEKLWLVLRRVVPSQYGVDLTEYIKADFFKDSSNMHHAQQLVLQLLAGIQHISDRGVSLRDVKPDNVLIDYDTTTHVYTARWTDFGLAVDLSDNGTHLRHPSIEARGEELQKLLVGWWYDAQKQVPKPKWTSRCPPEKSYQGTAMELDNLAAYDMYMLGIIFCCMACSIDFPHIGTRAIDEDVRELLGSEGYESDDYYKNFELGRVISAHVRVFEHEFEQTFGKTFGRVLLAQVRMMLTMTPSLRPTPEQVRRDLKRSLDCE